MKTKLALLTLILLNNQTVFAAEALAALTLASDKTHPIIPLTDEQKTEVITLLSKKDDLSPAEKTEFECFKKTGVIPEFILNELLSRWAPEPLVCAVAQATHFNTHHDSLDAKTPLHRTADFGYEQATRLLIERGAEVNARDHSHRTPLFPAAFMGHINIVKQLADSGADLTVTDNKRLTVLSSACNLSDMYPPTEDRFATIAYLLKKAPSLATTKPNDRGWRTPLDHVIEFKNTLKTGGLRDDDEVAEITSKILELLLSHKAVSNLFHFDRRLPSSEEDLSPLLIAYNYIRISQVAPTIRKIMATKASHINTERMQFKRPYQANWTDEEKSAALKALCNTSPAP